MSFAFIFKILRAIGIIHSVHEVIKKTPAKKTSCYVKVTPEMCKEIYTSNKQWAQEGRFKNSTFKDFVAVTNLKYNMHKSSSSISRYIHDYAKTIQKS